ncbi:MAG: hypothetical protein ACTSQJ_07500 [Promethearchaeota archaeon]
MSQTYEATQRCPRCGNENQADSYQCSFCGKRLRVERIESIKIFRRFESEEWVAPYPFHLKLLYLYIDPPRAFWDINHKRSDAPGFKILLINALLYGVMGLAFMVHFRIASIDGASISPYSLFLFPYYMSGFLLFFAFGFVFQLIFYLILIWLFTKGANYAVGYSERLKTRFGVSKEEKKKYIQAEMSPFSIYKGGVLLQKQESHKMKMMMCAFAPFIIINAIKILVILIALPTVKIDVQSKDFSLDVYDPMLKSPVWAVLDVIDALTIAIWVPILMTIAIRELSNSSTFRVMISAFAVGIIVSIFFYFLRPTLFGALI